MVAGLACLLILAVMGLLVSPALIHLQTVRDQIQEHFSKEFSGQIKFARIDLSIFPRPRAIVTQVRFRGADGVDARLPALNVYPKIWPLILGDVQLDRLTLESPEVVVKLKERPESETAIIDAFQFDRIGQRIIATLLLLTKWQPPDLAFRISNGRLILLEPNRPMLELSNVQARMDRGARLSNYSLSARSNLWQQISIKGWIDPSQSTKAGRIDLSQVQPRILSGLLFPDSRFKIVEAPLILSIDFESTGEDRLVAVVNGSLPRLRIKKETTDVLLKGYNLRSTLQIEAGQASLSIDELTLNEPRLNVSGRFSWNPAEPRAAMELNAGRIDVAGLRKTVLALLGHRKIVREIFEIIRAGVVPDMTVRSNGDSIADLGQIANLLIQGRMSQGHIVVPGIQLDLSEVQGQATISAGVLSGEAMSAQLGNSRGHSGKMTLDLTGDSGILQLEIQVKADLAQLPPVLQRLVTHKAFQSELARITNVVGSAVGVLKLAGTTNDVVVAVEASDIDLKLNYDRIPYPISLNKGKVSLDGSSLRLTQLDATVAPSSFYQLSGSFSWQEPAALMEIQFEKCVLVADQLYAFLNSLRQLPPLVSDLVVQRGNILLQQAQVKGPLFQPGRWRLETRGNIDDLKLTWPVLPKPLSIASGKISCDTKQLKLYELKGSLGTSSFSQASVGWNLISGSRFAAASGPLQIAVDEVVPWIAPHMIGLQTLTPLTGRVTLARVAVEGTSAAPLIHVRGEIDKYELTSPKLPGRVSGSGGAFSWQNRRLQIDGMTADVGRSSVKRMAVGLQWADPVLLEASAESVVVFLAEVDPWLSALAETDPRPAGSSGIVRLTGTQVTGPLLHPDIWLVHASGNLDEVVIPLVSLPDPMIIHQAGFTLSSDKSGPSKAVRHVISFDSLPFEVGDDPMRFRGRLGFGAETISLEGDLQAELIDWNRFGNGRPQTSQSDPESWLWRLQGSLQVTAGQFKYATYTWSPTQAAILFGPDSVRIAVNQADLCDISFSGIIRLSPKIVELYIVPAAKQKRLDPSLTCVLQQKGLATGEYDLHGELLAKSKTQDLTRALMGDVSFAAANGRIYRFGLLAKILALLNVTEIFGGQVPDLVQEGFAYRSINLVGEFQSGRVLMKECVIDGASMGIGCEGDIDLINQEMDLTVLVAPLKTVDRIVGKLPIINNILGGTLISIPFRATGKIGNPTVIPLSPTAVGSGVLGIMERTLKLPITLIQPIMTQSKAAKPADRKPESQNPRHPTRRGED
jgi:AsmA-like C-terminal region